MNFVTSELELHSNHAFPAGEAARLGRPGIECVGAHAPKDCRDGRGIKKSG